MAGFDYRRIPTLRLAQERGLISEALAQRAVQEAPRLLDRPSAPPQANPLAAFIQSPARQKYFLAVRNTTLFTYLAGTGWFGGLLFKTGLRQGVSSQAKMDWRGLSLDQGLCDGCGLCVRYAPWTQLALGPDQ